MNTGSSLHSWTKAWINSMFACTCHSRSPRFRSQFNSSKIAFQQVQHYQCWRVGLLLPPVNCSNNQEIFRHCSCERKVKNLLPRFHFQECQQTEFDLFFSFFKPELWRNIPLERICFADSFNIIIDDCVSKGRKIHINTRCSKGTFAAERNMQGTHRP